MGFYVDFTVNRGATSVANVEITYKYNNSSRNLSSDFTDKRGKVRTNWDGIWLGREVDVFFDGEHRRTITLQKNDEHIIRLPGGCFTLDAAVSTPFGLRRLGDLRHGDWVLGWDEATCSLAKRKVIHVSQHAAMRVHRVHLVNGTVLRVTSNHRLRAVCGFKAVGALCVGDQLFHVPSNLESIDEKVSQGVPIVAIEPDIELAPVGNLIVAGDFNFVVEGQIAHSFAKASLLQHGFWRIVQVIQEVSAIAAQWCCPGTHIQTDAPAPATRSGPAYLNS